jgi:putative (di)nucleoside polyphosphate hydrolase
MGRKSNPGFHTSLDDLLADPLVRMVMRADKVDAAHIRQLYQDVGSRRPRGVDAHSSPDGELAIFPGTTARYRSGVGIMLLNVRNEVFVGQRIGMSGDAWQMPQGGIEEGEDPRAAALRELREEIGTDNVDVLTESRGWLRYDLPEELVGKAWGGRWRGQQQKWFAMRFRGRDADIDIATEHPEFSAWRWVSAEHLAELIVLFKRQTCLEVLRQFQDLQIASVH